jgi:division protein CdvB (Snf7/Vps24/ESCRT-III family)
MSDLDKNVGPREIINRTREAMLAQQLEEVDRLTERLESVAVLIRRNQVALLEVANKLAAEALTPVAQMAKVFDALEKAGSIAKCNFKPTEPAASVRTIVDQRAGKPMVIAQNSMNWTTVIVALTISLSCCTLFALIIRFLMR